MLDFDALTDGILVLLGIVVVFSFTLGALCVWGLPKLWNFLKPIIHTLTA